jgi:hypothetical protein
MNTYELEGAELDAAVAQALGCTVVRVEDGPTGDPLCFARGPSDSDHPTWKSENAFCPSTVWEDGGPIIERERIELIPQRVIVECAPDAHWQAVIRDEFEAYGPTALIAAMRAYVASKELK